MSTLAVIATSTLTGVIGAAAMYVPARLALRDARTYRDEADRTFNAAESLADEVERTRNMPWHYAAIEAAPEPEPAEHEGEVLHVEHATAELRQLIAQLDATDNDVMDALPAISDEPEHDDEDAPADDTDRPGLWLVLLAVPVALWDRLCEWWQSLWAARRERHMVGSGEQATDGDPFAELLAHVEHDRTSEAEELALLDEQWRTAVAAARAESSPRHASDEVAQDKGYRGSRWKPGIEHTGLHPIVVPAQRDGGDE